MDEIVAEQDKNDTPSEAVTQTERELGWSSLMLITVGNFVEWFDFGVVGVVAGELGKNFFPGGESQSRMVEGLFIFGVAFLIRPIGAAVFGRIADTYGRSISLQLSIAAMGVATLGIGMCPTYNTIGISGAVFLIIFRLIQGISVGGEGYTAVVYIYETANRDHKVWFLSMCQLSCLAGCVFGNLVVYILQATLTKEQMTEYGWRFPFLLSFAMILAASYFRQQLTETGEFLQEAESTEQAGSSCAGNVEWPTLFALIAMKCSDPFWTLTAWLPDHLYEQGVTGANLGVVLSQVLVACVLATFISVFDRVNYYPYMVMSKIGAVLIGIPIVFFSLPVLNSAPLVFAATAPLMLFEFTFNCLMDVYSMKLLPNVKTRATTMALAHNLSGWVWGTLPFWASVLVANGVNPQYVGVLLLTVATCALLSMHVVYQNESSFTEVKVKTTAADAAIDK